MSDSVSPADIETTLWAQGWLDDTPQCIRNETDSESTHSLQGLGMGLAPSPNLSLESPPESQAMQEQSGGGGTRPLG